MTGCQRSRHLPYQPLRRCQASVHRTRWRNRQQEGPRPAGWRSRDGGSVSLELALLVPVIFSLLVLIVFAGRIVDARGDVTSAAGDAARAASIERSWSEAQTAALNAVDDTLATEGVQCSGGVDPDVEVLGLDGGPASNAEFGPGNYVRVTVHCDVELSDLPDDFPGINLAATVPASAEAIEIVDQHRGEG